MAGVMQRKLRIRSRQAFTRVELLIALASVGLLGTVGISVLASSAIRNDSAVCANNLRQVGRAFHMWASDHGGENPWWTSYTDGGSYVRPGGPPPPGGILNVPGMGPVPAALRGNAWVHFAYIGPELRNAGALVCPTDRTKVRAQDFSSSTGGYFSLPFRDRATSYFIGMHAVSLFPSSMLGGDRSIRETSVDANCVVNVGPLSMLFLVGGARGWNTDLHPGGGNILANDGRVEELSADGLTRFLGPNGDDNGSTHFQKPQ